MLVDLHCHHQLLKFWWIIIDCLLAYCTSIVFEEKGKPYFGNQKTIYDMHEWWILNRRGSFLGLLSDNSFLLDFDFFDVFAKSILNGLDNGGFVSFEGEDVAASSDLELGDLVVLLDKDSYMTTELLLFAGLAFLSALFPSLSRLRNSFGVFTSLG